MKFLSYMLIRIIAPIIVIVLIVTISLIYFSKSKKNDTSNEINEETDDSSFESDQKRYIKNKPEFDESSKPHSKYKNQDTTPNDNSTNNIHEPEGNNHKKKIFQQTTPEYNKTVQKIEKRLVESGIKSPSTYRFMENVTILGENMMKQVDVCEKEFALDINEFVTLYGNETPYTTENETESYQNKVNKILQIFEKGDNQTFKNHFATEISKDEENIKSVEEILKNYEKYNPDHILSLDAIDMEIKLNELQALHIYNLDAQNKVFIKSFKKLLGYVDPMDARLVFYLYHKYMELIEGYKEDGGPFTRSLKLKKLRGFVEELNERFKIVG